MAGDSDYMKEQLVYDNCEDPLSTKPPFGGAEAKPQNSDYPDLTPKDIECVEDLVRSYVGVYPTDAPWHEPQSVWIETLKRRKGPISQANSLIHEHFVKEHGMDSDVAITTGILAQITPELTQIAVTQFEQGYHGPKSWQKVNPVSSQILEQKVNSILRDKSKVEYFLHNPSIKKGLDLIQNVLVPLNNPDKIYEKHSEYMKACIEANSNRQPILYIPLESDFTHPVKSEQEKTKICEATVSVVLPIDREDRLEFDKLMLTTWELLKQRKNAHKTNSKLNAIVGINIMGAGFDTLDSTVGESFIIKQNGGHEHGVYLAVNNMAKKIDFWQASTELLNIPSLDDPKKYYRNFLLLYVLHEEGHRLFPVHGIHGEVPADIPAVIYALKISQNPNLIGITDPNHEFETHEIIKAILTEYVSEIVNGVSDKDWFEGHNSNSGNDLFDGYLLSSVVIVNSIASSGIARVNRERLIDINLSPENLRKLFKDLETIDTKFHNGDEKTLDKIKLAVCNPEARKIVELYRNTIRGKQFTSNISLPLEMVK
jgi:hypothetical protein